MSLRPGDVIHMASFTHVQPGFSVGYKSGKGRVSVFILLGNTEKAAPEQFDPDAAIRRLGWVPAQEKADACSELLAALEALTDASRPVSNVAFNLGQRDEQWESSIRPSINALDKARNDALKAIAKAKGGAR